ncbi:MAG: carbohydrate porin [Planctomycetota bacterium]
MFLVKSVLFCCLFVISLAAGSAFTEEGINEDSPQDLQDFTEDERPGRIREIPKAPESEIGKLFDLWGGRPWLEDRGFTFELVYRAEWFWNTRGGITTHHARKYRGDVSLYMELDTEAAGMWKNGTFFAHVQHQHGDGITEKYVGDFQVLSNIDADDFTQISDLWYRHSFFDDKLWTKVGKQEANTDFAFVEYGGEFINSSAGFHPTIPLATYPDPDLGVVVGIAPIDDFSVNIGMYNGRPDGGRSPRAAFDNLYGPMVMVEPVIHYDVADRPGRFRLGGWYNGDRFDELDKNNPNPGDFGHSKGWYLTWDQELMKENLEEEEDEQGIGFFGQYGWAPEDRSEAEHYIGGGIQWIGAVPSRDEDILGLAVYHVDFSDEAGFEKESETAYELFYKIQLLPQLSLKPDFQYITNPGGTKNDDAFVVGVRAEFVF